MKHDFYRSHLHSYQFEVLARGFTPFQTDNLEEALHDAARKAVVSDFVSVLDDGERLAVWRNGQRIQIISPSR